VIYAIAALAAFLGAWFALTPRKTTINISIDARDPEKWLRDMDEMVRDKKLENLKPKDKTDV
jgi:hypothetical protein